MAYIVKDSGKPCGHKHRTLNGAVGCMASRCGVYPSRERFAEIQNTSDGTTVRFMCLMVRGEKEMRSRWFEETHARFLLRAQPARYVTYHATMKSAEGEA